MAGGCAWWGACMVGVVHGRGVCVAGGMHGRGEACMVGGVCGRGACMAGGGMHGRRGCACHAPPPVDTTATAYSQ